MDRARKHGRTPERCAIPQRGAIHPNEYFDHVYCLNLQRRADKWNSLRRRLKRQGITAERFPGVDGSRPAVEQQYRDLLDDVIPFNAATRRYSICNSAAFGCLLGHARILEDARLHGYSRILVLEDDACLHRDFLREFQRVSQLPVDWKLLYLGSSQYSWKGICPYNESFYHACRSLGTFAFGIDASVYDETLSLCARRTQPVDVCLSEIQQRYPRQCFVFSPNIAIADVTRSDIREPRRQAEQAGRMKWDLRLYDMPDDATKVGWNSFHPRRISSARQAADDGRRLVLAVCTYNRLDYLRKLIDTWHRTRCRRHRWTLLIADDGSTDGTPEYLRSVCSDDCDVLLIENRRVGVHAQQNSLFEKMMEIGFDFAFVANDDIWFARPAWEELYLNASKRSGYSHLCYFNTDWKPPLFERVCRDGVEAVTDVENCLGCFWTVTPEVLRTVGYLDVASFGFRGHGHIDFSMRCCRAGFNRADTFFDAAGSQQFVKMQPRSGYRPTISDDDLKKYNNPEETSRRMAIIRRADRVFVPLPAEIPSAKSGNALV